MNTKMSLYMAAISFIRSFLLIGRASLETLFSSNWGGEGTLQRTKEAQMEMSVMVSFSSQSSRVYINYLLIIFEV